MASIVGVWIFSGITHIENNLNCGFFLFLPLVTRVLYIVVNNFSPQTQ